MGEKKVFQREEEIAKDTPIIIKQEIREDGIIVCDVDCIFYDDEHSDGCLIFQVKWDENIFHFKPHTCPGPGEYQLCPK
jgi:hypothetical protein